MVRINGVETGGIEDNNQERSVFRTRPNAECHAYYFKIRRNLQPRG
jgi:hypothetical protein